MTQALIVVDVQNDFLPTGTLPVPEGDAVIPVINELARRYPLVVATQDWHPADHGSFAASHPDKQPYEVTDLAGLRQVLWPVHCVQGTLGAEFAPGLDTSRIAHVVRKGTDREIDSYSGFFDNGHRRDTGLADFLRAQGVDEVAVVGLATDYCVKFTALDARRLGFRTTVIEDACRGVDVNPADVAAALEELRAAGVKVERSS
jgi:nicotinamidase/pyrazinamidase